MKKLKLFLLMIMILSIILLSCSSTEDNGSKWRNTDTFSMSRYMINSIDISSDGNKIIAGDGINLGVWEWNGSRWKYAHLIKKVNSFSVDLSSDGNKIVSGGNGSDIYVSEWNGSEWEIKQKITGHKYNVTSVAFNPDGDKIVSCSSYFYGSVDKITIWAFNGTDWRYSCELDNDIFAYTVNFSPYGNKIVAGLFDSSIVMWEFNGSEWIRIHTLEGHKGWASSLRFSPDGNKLVSSSGIFPSGNPTFMIWEFDGSEWINTHNLTGHKKGVSSVAFSPDGNKIVAGSFDDKLTIWEFDGSEWINTYTLKGHNNPVSCVAFSPVGNRIISSSIDGVIKVWEQ